MNKKPLDSYVKGTGEIVKYLYMEKIFKSYAVYGKTHSECAHGHAVKKISIYNPS